VQLGADVHAQDQDGRVALQWAAVSGQAETVKALAELGADVRARDKDQLTALDWAKRNGHEATVKVLEDLVKELIREMTQPYLQKYSYAELAHATGNFSPASKIGEGGFGKVYKGQLLGMQVAVKKLDSNSMQGQDELHRELEILGSMSHRHLVHLYGWCQTERCLVYELCEKGSLEECLPQLRWYDRVRVAKEVCLAVIFLHKRKPDGIIHRDIKPSNILLDQLGTVKLADVGLGKILYKAGMNPGGADPTCVMTSTIVGTFAYTDPEYMRTGLVSYSSDVYSLGVLFLHMLTGRSANSQVRICDFVEDAIKTNKESLIDTAAGLWPLAHAEEFAKIALRCVQEQRNKRPDLERDVLPKLMQLFAQCTPGVVEDILDEDQSLCVVCMHAARTHTFLPCGHRCVCGSDADKLMSSTKLCPICRENATSVVRIYI